MKKNNIKTTIAIIYIIVGIIMTFLCICVGISMYLSPSFLPVYVGKTFVIGNKIFRYILYILLLVGLVTSMQIVTYGWNYLTKRFQRKRHQLMSFFNINNNYLKNLKKYLSK